MKKQTFKTILHLYKSIIIFLILLTIGSIITPIIIANSKTISLKQKVINDSKLYEKMHPNYNASDINDQWDCIKQNKQDICSLLKSESKSLSSDSINTIFDNMVNDALANKRSVNAENSYMIKQMLNSSKLSSSSMKTLITYVNSVLNDSSTTFNHKYTNINVEMPLVDTVAKNNCWNWVDKKPMNLSLDQSNALFQTISYDYLDDNGDKQTWTGAIQDMPLLKDNNLTYNGMTLLPYKHSYALFFHEYKYVNANISTLKNNVNVQLNVSDSFGNTYAINCGERQFDFTTNEINYFIANEINSNDNSSYTHSFNAACIYSDHPQVDTQDWNGFDYNTYWHTFDYKTEVGGNINYSTFCNAANFDCAIGDTINKKMFNSLFCFGDPIEHYAEYTPSYPKIESISDATAKFNHATQNLNGYFTIQVSKTDVSVDNPAIYGDLVWEIIDPNTGNKIDTLLSKDKTLKYTWTTGSSSQSSYTYDQCKLRLYWTQEDLITLKTAQDIANTYYESKSELGLFMNVDFDNPNKKTDQIDDELTAMEKLNTEKKAFAGTLAVCGGVLGGIAAAEYASATALLASFQYAEAAVMYIQAGVDTYTVYTLISQNRSEAKDVDEQEDFISAVSASRTTWSPDCTKSFASNQPLVDNFKNSSTFKDLLANAKLLNAQFAKTSDVIKTPIQGMLTFAQNQNIADKIPDEIYNGTSDNIKSIAICFSIAFLKTIFFFQWWITFKAVWLNWIKNLKDHDWINQRMEEYGDAVPNINSQIDMVAYKKYGDQTTESTTMEGWIEKTYGKPLADKYTMITERYNSCVEELEFTNSTRMPAGIKDFTNAFERFTKNIKDLSIASMIVNTVAMVADIIFTIVDKLLTKDLLKIVEKN